ncbi:substrate-binding periplasmic protein [Marinobacter apostichopi]|uniref:substrate-binding periplasmic protein n=1 Tax=Marinobacter apostichopi TaxID=3035454 RepID=UPI0025744A7C|nr:transporter substrate-binding domain-containing protein [Marinobacter sp. LA51]
MIEIAREAFALARLEVEYVNMSWARALELADEGYIDAVVGAFTRDSTGFVYPEEAIGYARTALFTHIESDWTYQGIESLRQQTLVTINGYSYSSELDAYIDKHRDNPERVWILSGPSPLNRAIEMLEHDRSDVLPEDLDVMQWTLGQLGKQDSLRMVAKLERLPVYIAFSEARPQSEEYATLLTEGVRKLRQSGRLDEILARYNVSWSD